MNKQEFKKELCYKSAKIFWLISDIISMAGDMVDEVGHRIANEGYGK